MIIVTTKTETHFLNDKDFQEIVYRKDVQQVSAYRYIESKNDIGQKLILNVTAVRYVTDATQMDGTEVDPDVIRENNILQLQMTKNSNFISYLQRQHITYADAIDDIYRMSTSKDVNHKTAREHITKLCEKCISQCDETYNEAKKNGWI